VKIFVDADADLRLIRRIAATSTSGRPLTILEQYLTTVQPMHFEFVEPTSATPTSSCRAEATTRSRST
jgi:uridine kinase